MDGLDKNGNLTCKEISLRVLNPKEDFTTCDHCIHANDSIEICQFRKCVHSINVLQDCFERDKK